METQKIKDEFDEWYKNQKEMTPYIMRDWFLSMLSQNRIELREKIEGIKGFKTYQKPRVKGAKDGEVIYKDDVIKLLD